MLNEKIKKEVEEKFLNTIGELFNHENLNSGLVVEDIMDGLNETINKYDKKYLSQINEYVDDLTYSKIEFILIDKHVKNSTFLKSVGENINLPIKIKNEIKKKFKFNLDRMLEYILMLHYDEEIIFEYLDDYDSDDEEMNEEIGYYIDELFENKKLKITYDNGFNDFEYV